MTRMKSKGVDLETLEDMTSLDEVFNALSTIRAYSGKTQSEVERDTGISRVRISELENGKAGDMHVSTLLRLLQVNGMALTIHPDLPVNMNNEMAKRKRREAGMDL